MECHFHSTPPNASRPRINLPEQPRNPAPRLRMHRQHVDDVGPVVAMSVAVAEQVRGDRVAVGWL
jgi:hypothetical protein